MRKNPILIVHLALFSVNLIYAGNYTIAKTLMPHFVQPFGFIFMRVTIAWMLLAILNEFVAKTKIQKEDIPRLILCGLTGVACNQLLFFKGLDLTTPINASLIMITAPILVMVMSVFMLKEKLTSLKIAGLTVGALGAFMIIYSGAQGNMVGGNWLGDLFVMLNATSYAIYLVIVKPLMKKYPPLTVIKWVFFFGMFPVVLVGFNDFRAIDWQTATTNTYAALVYVIVGTTFIAYLFNIFALSKANPSLVGIYIYLQPILATVIAVIFRGDKLTNLHMLAAVLIFIGVYLVSLKPKQTRAAT